MNLALHSGWLGVLEAAGIALVIGALCFALFHWLAERHRWPHGHSMGWSSLLGLAIATGIDAWNLFYMGVVRLESPVQARLVLSKIHDPEFLATRVFMSSLAVLTGVALAWMALHAKRRAR